MVDDDDVEIITPPEEAGMCVCVRDVLTSILVPIQLTGAPALHRC